MSEDKRKEGQGAEKRPVLESATTLTGAAQASPSGADMAGIGGVHSRAVRRGLLGCE